MNWKADELIWKVVKCVSDSEQVRADVVVDFMCVLLPDFYGVLQLG